MVVSALNRRAIMYVQQMEYLKYDSFEDLLSGIENYLEEHDLSYEYAAIVHDQDLESESSNEVLAKPHVHVQFYCSDKLSKKHLLQMTKETEWNRFEYRENKVESFKYLIHATKNSRSKYQYSVHDVRSNFDYVGLVNSNRSENETVDDILTGIINGSITFTDLQTDDDLSLLYAKNKSKFDNALSIATERRVMSDDINAVSTIWIHSEYSGIGKTMLAHRKAKEFIAGRNMSIYESSANNDLFQDYKGQEVVIIDDLRPQDIGLTDILRLLDPNFVGSAKSRYNNKRITAELIIVTSLLSPYEYFYSLVSDVHKEPIDQFLRRISYVCELEREDDTKYLSSAYVYRVERLEEPEEVDFSEHSIVTWFDEVVRTNYGLKFKKKR